MSVALRPRKRRADEPEKVGKRERGCERADQNQEAHSTLGRARAAAFAARGERPEARRDQTENVEKNRAAHQPVPVLRRKHQDQHRHAEHARDSEQGRAALGLWNDRLEQVQRKLRQEHRQDRGEARPDVGAYPLIEPLREVPKPDVGGERRKEELWPLGAATQQDRYRDRQRQRAAEQRGPCA